MYSYFVHYTTNNPPSKSNGVVETDEKIITEEHLRQLEGYINRKYKLKDVFITNITLLHEA